MTTYLHAPIPHREERYRAIRRITHIGSLLDVVLAVLKISVGWLSQSQALIADGVHSFSDLLTNFVVLFAAREAHREADKEHPYGHERIESITTAGLGTILVLVAMGIGFDAIRRLFEPELLLRPGVWALVVAAISVLAKESIYRYTMHIGRKLRSELLQANAWHSRSDAISSIVVIIGVGGSMAGLAYVDAIAAILVAGMIAKIGIKLGWNAVRELIDTGVEEQVLVDIRRAILAVDGVETLHMLRTRRMGGNILVDVHITLTDSRVSVSEGHQISEVVMTALLDNMEEVTDVTVHIDPENDELSTPNRGLPLRNEIVGRLYRCWPSINASGHIQRINLHYLNGKLHVEVVLPITVAANKEEMCALSEAFRLATHKETDIGQIQVLYVC
uniref:Cation diffusion facilitator family transporter n=1 Tax=Candidatus Kentrum sp. FM TaxID=2126340 RepID=A0A450S935_9GAMM|nr:MAG: cation diffusion facilitator family transporter [Candidatus Kentron sp. FM]VFJ57152.1 MAG: cation diffusion facilitator family transporter [Candidatus Kentron sp. FM]VFK08023.1 MAG: cation diffusion facilitator family transporter [Candidatus Kentron sp. FM]